MLYEIMLFELKGYEVLFYWEHVVGEFSDDLLEFVCTLDLTGIKEICDWETLDGANRRTYKLASIEQAYDISRNKRLLQTFVC